MSIDNITPTCERRRSVSTWHLGRSWENLAFRVANVNTNVAGRDLRFHWIGIR